MAMVWRPSVVFCPCVCDGEGGCTYMLYNLMGGGRGGKCPIPF